MTILGVIFVFLIEAPKGTDNILGSFWMNAITGIIPSFLDILSLKAFFLE